MNYHIESRGTFSKQAHVDIPEGSFEEEHGRKGFFGRVSQIYHENPPVGWTDIEGELKPRCLPPLFSNVDKKNEFIPLLYNSDVIINFSYFDEDFNSFFRNADFDELFFVHSGQGQAETLYGTLELKKGDYVVIPRGTTYKIFVQSPLALLKIESRGEFEQPDRGLLGPNALYDQTLIEKPKLEKGREQNLSEYQVVIKRLGKLTTVTYPFNPIDAIGWKGSLFPYKLSIYDIAPIMSHRYHIPPSGHTTFLSKNFVICSFVERPLEDSKHKVLKVPFYHSNIDFDEVLFYHQGNFFSRDNIDAGALSFHPQGIHHGPHPNAFKNTMDKTYTDEYAVMIDTNFPLERTKYFRNHEVQDYWKSWMEK